jgi:flagellar hook-length control protein FliK
MEIRTSAPLFQQKRQEVAMSQMVLPPDLTSSPAPEAAKSSGASRPGNEKSGDSAYDEVSRSEQNRLDEQKREDARAAKDAEAANQDKAPEQRTAENAGAEEPANEKVGSGSERKELAGEGSARVADEAEIDSVPVTFVGLQSLVASTQTATEAPAMAAQTPASQANGQALPFLQGTMLTTAGQGNGAKAGAMMLSSQGQGATPGLALAESLLAGVTGDGVKAADSPMLQNAIRFQGALESASAQANSVNTPKMAPETPILRGYTTSVDVPVSHAEWGDKVAGKLTWLTARNMSVAEIHLTPPDMGPMEVKVSVQQDQANIQVHSANPVVREQLELHSQRLRDMLSEQGLSLEQFDVSDSGSDQTRDGESGGGESTGTGVIAGAESEESLAEPVSLDLTWKGQVDIFA